jgi:hypothetical protein
MHEARFADSCRTEKREKLARFVGNHLFEGRLEQATLALASNER